MTDQQPSARDQRQAALQVQDARRLLSRQYLAGIDRTNEEFLENPDDRPNSGQREGEISHAEVNAIIRASVDMSCWGKPSRA